MCNKFAQRKCKRTHDNLCKIVHWKLVRQCNFEVKGKWYEEGPESILENEVYKVLWDFNIQADHVIESLRVDLVDVSKKSRTCEIIAVPGDSRIDDKEKEKIEKYLRSSYEVAENLE